MEFTFKQFLAEMEQDDNESQYIDQEFVNNNTKLLQAQKMMGSEGGRKRFFQLYKRETMKNPEQRRKQMKMKRATADGNDKRNMGTGPTL